jgi:hypothetical protein
MQIRSLDLDPETIEKLEKIEQAINYWSRQNASLVVKRRRIEDQLVGMFDSRDQLFSEIIEKSGLPEGSKIKTILESGEVQIAIPEKKAPSGS